MLIDHVASKCRTDKEVGQGASFENDIWPRANKYTCTQYRGKSNFRQLSPGAQRDIEIRSDVGDKVSYRQIAAILPLFPSSASWTHTKDKAASASFSQLFTTG
jgi:hypothetical protein